MTECKCLACVHVVAADGNSTATLELTLPFMPFIGLDIAGVQDGYESYEVQGVMWDLAKHGLILELGTDESAFDRSPTFTLEQMKAQYRGDWKWADEVKPS